MSRENFDTLNLLEKLETRNGERDGSEKRAVNEEAESIHLGRNINSRLSFKALMLRLCVHFL